MGPNLPILYAYVCVINFVFVKKESGTKQKQKNYSKTLTQFFQCVGIKFFPSHIVMHV